MDEGRIAGTTDLWAADHIWQLPDAETIDWRCPGCEAKVIARAWRTDRSFKVSPNFAVKGPHDPGCGINGFEKLISSGESKTIRSENGLPAPYPSALRFIDRHEHVVPDDIDNRSLENRLRHKRGGTALPKNQDHHRTATNIRPLCRFYQAFPQLRHLPLTIPNGDGSTYRELFRPLKNNDNGPIIGKILFAGLRFRDIPMPDADPFHISLNVYLTNTTQNGKDIRQPFTLLVDMTTWSPAKRTLFLNRFMEARENLEERYKSRAADAPYPSAFVYFMSTRLGSDVATFIVDDPSKIFFLEAA